MCSSGLVVNVGLIDASKEEVHASHAIFNCFGNVSSLSDFISCCP